MKLLQSLIFCRSFDKRLTKHMSFYAVFMDENLENMLKYNFSFYRTYFLNYNAEWWNA